MQLCLPRNNDNRTTTRRWGNTRHVVTRGEDLHAHAFLKTSGRWSVPNAPTQRLSTITKDNDKALAARCEHAVQGKGERFSPTYLWQCQPPDEQNNKIWPGCLQSSNGTPCWVKSFGVGTGIKHEQQRSMSPLVRWWMKRPKVTHRPLQWNEPGIPLVYLNPPPREDFFSGRTEAVRAHCQAQPNQHIFYDDFTSLYPWVNKNCQYPVGHPVIHTQFTCQTPEDWDRLVRHQSYGLVQCRVLPPHYLFHPLGFPHGWEFRFVFKYKSP